MSAPIIHFMQHGLTACLKEGTPDSWPPGELWDPEWENVTCQECLAGLRFPGPTFVVSLCPPKSSITCLRCQRTSYHPEDVANHYCGHCHAHHNQILPWARRAWLKLPPPA